MDISVIVPVYNGENTIEELFERTVNVLGGRYSFEVIFVHDSGTRGSREVISRLASAFPGRVKSIYLLLNGGQHSAILEGIKVAQGDFIVTMDEDLQHDPAFIPVLKEKQSEGSHDVVYARFRKLEHPCIRARMSKLVRDILLKIIPGLCPYYSPYRLIRRETALGMFSLRNGYDFIDGYLARLTDRYGFIDAEHYRRADGKSSYSYRKLIKHAVLIALNHSKVNSSFLTRRVHKGRHSG